MSYTHFQSTEARLSSSQMEEIRFAMTFVRSLQHVLMSDIPLWLSERSKSHLLGTGTMMPRSIYLVSAQCSTLAPLGRRVPARMGVAFHDHSVPSSIRPEYTVYTRHFVPKCLFKDTSNLGPLNRLSHKEEAYQARLPTSLHP